ncbi:TPA: hypothetical protein ACUOAP_004107 [Salmonella enterica]
MAAITPSYTIVNPSYIAPETINGMDAGYVVTISGYLITNDKMWG